MMPEAWSAHVCAFTSLCVSSKVIDIMYAGRVQCGLGKKHVYYLHYSEHMIHLMLFIWSVHVCMCVRECVRVCGALIMWTKDENKG